MIGVDGVVYVGQSDNQGEQSGIGVAYVLSDPPSRGLTHPPFASESWGVGCGHALVDPVVPPSVSLLSESGFPRENRTLVFFLNLEIESWGFMSALDVCWRWYHSKMAGELPHGF